MIDLEKIRNSVGIIGESEQIVEMLSLIGQIASTDISVLVTGELVQAKKWLLKLFIKIVKENLNH